MVSPEDRPALEAEVRGLCERADLGAAVDRALRGYGPEVYGLLVARHDGEQDAKEVYSLWSVDLWKGLPGFAWRSSLRTWCYVLAHHASHRYRESPRTPYDPLSSSVLEIAHEVRPKTGSFLDPDKREQLDRMRALLPPEDRELFVLRLDRELSWKEIVLVLLGAEVAEDEEAFRRESARLRQRYQSIKEKLVEQGMSGPRGT